MTEYSYGPWIKHDGKRIPVDGDVLVSMRFTVMGGKQWTTPPIRSLAWNAFLDEGRHWVRQSDDDNSVISEYRIVTEVKP